MPFAMAYTLTTYNPKPMQLSVDDVVSSVYAILDGIHADNAKPQRNSIVC